MSDLRVALAGDDGTVRRAVEEAAGRVVSSDAPDADAFVAVGERALVDAALAGPTAPLFPVADADAGGTGGRVLDPSDLGAALDALASDGLRTTDHPLLSVRTGGERVARAVLDASLVTSEPAGISEYSVHADGERVARFRGDGVVVATPAGSAGYARATGGPLLEPGTGLAVVPVSPFTTRADTWVVADGVGLRVERDESEVSLVADDRVVRAVRPGTTLGVTAEGSVEMFDVARRFP